VKVRARRPWILVLIGAMVLLDLADFLWAKSLGTAHPSTLDLLGLKYRSLGPQTLLELANVIYGILLSPAAWQWTGDGRRQAPLARGFLQSLLLAAVMFLFLGRSFYQGGWPASPLLIPLDLAYGMVPGFLLCRWETRAGMREEARARTEEARWSLLRAQLSPHMLLNSLNGLSQLLRENPPAAVRGIQDLAQVYRLLLVLNGAGRPVLAEERRLLECCLAVEQLRLEDRLRIEWDWDPAVDACRAIPLVVQPLVENAIKHGVAPDPQGGRVRIAARRTEEGVRLEVSNTLSALGPRPGTGLGLRNLRARLDLAYRERARLEAGAQDGEYRAVVLLPTEV
jgi:signal transduction histidine kinase